jgi:hypothetical protein
MGEVSIGVPLGRSKKNQLKMRIVGASTSPPFTQATIAGWVFGVWNMNFLFHVIYGMSSETH